MTRPIGLRTFGLLGVGALAVSLAAPLMASLAVPALAIAFWRNALATAAIAPVAGWRLAHPDMRMSPEGQERTPAVPAATFAGPSARAWLVVAAGACLAAHFGFWISSLSMTSVASSTAIVSLQVLWVVGYDVLRGAEARAQVLAGVLLAVLGAVVVSGVDLSISQRALAGDGLALLGSVGVAAYAVIGGRVRQTMSTTAYTLGCYGTAAVLLLVATLASGQALTGYGADQWIKLGVLAATAQLLGHSVFNHLLATVSPMVVSLTILLEIPGASLIAAAWLRQVPEPAAFVGLVLVLAGMVVVVLSAPPSAGAEAVVA
ncbi:drug/metabolite transporter (DMT)-like permease [Marmoricola sp. URHA0025 HA25]